MLKWIVCCYISDVCYRNVSGSTFHLKYDSINNAVLEFTVHSFAQTNGNKWNYQLYQRDHVDRYDP
jgi:hypothetical protein